MATNLYLFNNQLHDEEGIRLVRVYHLICHISFIWKKNHDISTTQGLLMRFVFLFNFGPMNIISTSCRHFPSIFQFTAWTLMEISVNKPKATYPYWMKYFKTWKVSLIDLFLLLHKYCLLWYISQVLPD